MALGGSGVAGVELWVDQDGGGYTSWGMFSASPIAFTARPGERITGVVVFLTPALNYTGVVLDPQRRPVSGAQVKPTVLRTPCVITSKSVPSGFMRVIEA